MREPASAARRWLAAYRLPIVVFLLASIQYANTLSYDYAWDDKLAITANEYTKKGLRGLPEIFTKRVSVPYKSEYRPVPQALHAIEYEVFGHNPATGHLFNTLWYAATCVLVYALVRFTFVPAVPLFACLVAALFAVHPLHVEVVANIKGRDEILALFFGLSAIMILVRALERWSWTLAAAGALCVAAACLSKSNAVTLLPLVLLVAWYRADGPGVSRRLAGAAVAVGVCSIAAAAAIRYVQSTVSSDVVIHLNSTVLNNIFLWTTRPETIVPTALVIVLRYLRLFVVPHPLIHLYGYDQIRLSAWSDPWPWIALAGGAALAVLVLKTWRRKPPVVFGLLWAAATYSVYSNLFFYAPDTMADRYFFMPSVGISIVAVSIVFAAAALNLEAPVLTRRARVALVLFAVALVGYATKTVVANRDWTNDSTLIHNRIRYMENNAAAQAIYGHTLNKESADLATPEARTERKREAMNAFARAIAIYPDFQGAWLAIGKLFAEQGIYEKAELAFLKAQRLEPLNPDAYFCLGTLLLARRDPDLAIPYLEKAVLLNPRMEEAYGMLGRAYLQSNNLDNLGAMASTARQWFPENVELDALMATYHFRRQEFAQAFELAKGVVSREPSNMLAVTILSSPAAQNFRER